MPPKIHYIEMGPWPYFVGFTTSPDAYHREMRRLGIKDAKTFTLNEWSGAATHFFNGDDGSETAIICIAPFKKHREQYAGLVAHEATHVVQAMRDRLGNLGEEAEAYIVQRIVHEALMLAFKSTAKISKRPS